MSSQPGCCFCLRGASEEIQAEIVAEDAKQEFSLYSVAKNHFLRWTEEGRFAGCPMWNPQRVDVRCFVEQFSDVATLLCHSEAQMLVFN